MVTYVGIKPSFSSIYVFHYFTPSLIPVCEVTWKPNIEILGNSFALISSEHVCLGGEGNRKGEGEGRGRKTD